MGWRAHRQGQLTELAGTSPGLRSNLPALPVYETRTAHSRAMPVAVRYCRLYTYICALALMIVGCSYNVDSLEVLLSTISTYYNIHLRLLPYSNAACYFGWFGDFLIELIGSLYLEGQRPVYVQSPICVRVCSIDLRRITLVLMHILIQPPSSYKSSFSYKASDGAETHDPSTHATPPTNTYTE
jgi:hypothetical protein